MESYYLNSYAPLVVNQRGKQAFAARGIPPFVDGSIRREPDLEHPQPAITCLCRGSRFTPRLRVGDTVAYLTKKVRLELRDVRCRRLSAVLRVTELFSDHQSAADWYLKNGLALPSNIMVNENQPKLLSESHCKFHKTTLDVNDERGRRRWDRTYLQRVSRFPNVVICDGLFVDVCESAPIVTDDLLINAFGKIPGTQNPGKLPRAAFMKLLRLAHVKLPSSR